MSISSFLQDTNMGAQTKSFVPSPVVNTNSGWEKLLCLFLIPGFE